MKTQRIKTLLLFLSMIPFIGIYAPTKLRKECNLLEMSVG